MWTEQNRKPGRKGGKGIGSGKHKDITFRSYFEWNMEERDDKTFEEINRALLCVIERIEKKVFCGMQ